MTDSTPSAKRRHILSSINRDGPAAESQTRSASARPDDRHHGLNRESRETSSEASPKAEQSSRNAQSEEHGGDVHVARASRLRLKSSKSRRRRSRSRHRNEDKHDRHDKRDTRDARERHRAYDGDKPHSRSARHHRRRHAHRSPTPPNPFEPEPLDPEAAFRESLFDAMADDEGASYWESVYGQPIHVYSNERAGPMGELEQMTDEEYAAYVRQKMWEKTHAGLLEERARREERRRQKKDEERQARKLHQEMERSLRHGEQRRQKKRWTQQWEDYTRAWAAWDGALETLAWPVEGRLRKDVNAKDVRAFFVLGLGLEDIGVDAFTAKLKAERIRWHPDKMRQRIGGSAGDDVILDVTAVFQTIDQLWTDVQKS